MNLPVLEVSSDRDRLRKSEVFTILDEICRALELTPAQYESAKVSYEAVAAWLAASSEPLLQTLDVYAHGSAGLGTTVRPVGREDFDVDVICLVLSFTTGRSPAELKRLIGDRLRENATYAKMLEEKKRCWRLNYAREFHLDISPTVPNPICPNGGELVPDKQLREWKPTNPRGYKILFAKRASLQPRMRTQKALAAEDRASVEPFPAQSRHKGVLRRAVQLLKRHRDIYFLNVEEDVAPISIIITTLAARSFEMCVRTFAFETDYDVLVATIRMMPHFIERPMVAGRRIYVVENETTIGENFAERWNSQRERATAFFKWHEKALADFESLAALQGLDLMTDSLEKSLGSTVVRKVIDARTEIISKARETKSLYVAPSVGLSLSSGAHAIPVPKNTNFGD